MGAALAVRREGAQGRVAMLARWCEFEGLLRWADLRLAHERDRRPGRGVGDLHHGSVDAAARGPGTSRSAGELAREAVRATLPLPHMSRLDARRGHRSRRWRTAKRPRLLLQPLATRTGCWDDNWRAKLGRR